MRMMAATTTAGKQDKNNELCVQIWKSTEKKTIDTGVKEKKYTKLCYNNKIDNGIVCPALFLSLLLHVSMNETLKSRKCRTSEKRSKTTKKNHMKKTKPDSLMAFFSLFILQKR